MKSFSLFGILILIAVVASWFFFTSRVREAPPVVVPPVVLSFEDCVRAGYPVMESYPRQCKTPDGRTYAEEPTAEDRAKMITYKNASANNIVVETPWPGAVTGKTFTVTGKARGSWFFEASFPVRVLDRDGALIATAIAQAGEEWMTEDFVSFQATVVMPASYIGEATLVFERDNPSGLPANDAAMMFPITIEY